MVDCPICGKGVKAKDINSHIDSGCESHLDTGSPPLNQHNSTSTQKTSSTQKSGPPVSSFFQTPAAKRVAVYSTPKVEPSPTLSFQPKPQIRDGATTPNQP